MGREPRGQGISVSEDFGMLDTDKENFKVYTTIRQIHHSQNKNTREIGVLGTNTSDTASFMDRGSER